MKNKKFVAVFFLLFLFFAESSKAKSGLVITSWEENSTLTMEGKSSEIWVKGRVDGLPGNQILESVGIGFGKKQNIKILEVKSDGQPAVFSFEKGMLGVKFPYNKFTQGKKNNELITIYVSYKSDYEKINYFLREEVIEVPRFAAGANAKVTFNFPGYFESATFNPNITKIGDSYVYQKMVPQGGVFEIIKLTPAESVWDVTLNFKVTGNKPLGKIILELPKFFQSPRQKVENYILSPEVTPLNRKAANDGGEILTFNTQKQQMTVEENVRVSTGRNYRKPLNLDAHDYLKYSSEEAKLLTPVLASIKQNPDYDDNFPLYVKIGKFVHDFIKYDISYVGKLPEIKEILQNPVGVCSEYAKLYDALARLAGIPSLIVDGAACGEYTECRGHSWNMIFYNGNWIEVDPTWDLMSGVVSSSHVYLSNDMKQQGVVQYFDRGEKVNLEMDIVLKNIF